jgi:polyphosphate glucokinase
VALGFDVGGSTIKAARVEAGSGRIVGALRTAPTPRPATPAAVIDAIRGLAADSADRADCAEDTPVGFAFPTIVKAGRARTAANVDPSWVGVEGGALLAAALGRPVHFLNDADAAGLAEMRLGAGRGEQGLVLVLTFGTGIGSAPFYDGRLLPGTELGHLEVQGIEAERWASARVRAEQSLDWPHWAGRVNDVFARLDAAFLPDLYIVGGSVVEQFAAFGPLLEARAPIRAAALGAAAGAVGAALAAVDASAAAAAPPRGR